MLLGDEYWKNKIEQYSVTDTCFKTRYSRVWKLPEFFLTFYIRNKHIETKPVPDDLNEFIFEKVKKLCSPTKEIARCREGIYAPHQCLFDSGADLRWVSELDLDDNILALHVATAICEHESEEKGSLNFNVNNTLSKYCAYLLFSHRNLLPLHPDTTKITYMNLHRELASGKYRNVKELKNVFRGESSLGKGTKLARKLLKIERKQMWELLADYWVALLLYIAVYNKAEFHAQCLTTGGQFLTQLWVLLGHMGCGEQSDSAVTKKVEDKTIREKEDEENRRKEEIKRKESAWREEDEQVRRQKLKRSRLWMRTFGV
ncbi:hypothetical protein SUGI_0369740 [Cryptomeria japonica]|nr:hypothetical protein SUGI_0369740 [Cryptomeria japonica]